MCHEILRVVGLNAEWSSSSDCPIAGKRIDPNSETFKTLNALDSEYGDLRCKAETLSTKLLDQAWHAYMQSKYHETGSIEFYDVYIDAHPEFPELEEIRKRKRNAKKREMLELILAYFENQKR